MANMPYTQSVGADSNLECKFVSMRLYALGLLTEPQCNRKQWSSEGTTTTFRTAPEGGCDIGQWYQDCPHGIDNSTYCSSGPEPSQLPSPQGNSFIRIECWLSRTSSGGDGVGSRCWTFERKAPGGQAERH